MNPNTKSIVKMAATAVGIGMVVLIMGMVLLFQSFRPAPPAPIARARSITDVACGQTYQLEHTELYYPKGSTRVARNFTFGGADRNRQPQYIWDRNVLGQSTEIRSARRVVRSLAYSLVSFQCQADSPLEGLGISNVEVMRYSLTLRRPLRPQTVIRNGGPARK